MYSWGNLLFFCVASMNLRFRISRPVFYLRLRLFLEENLVLIRI